MEQNISVSFFFRVAIVDFVHKYIFYSTRAASYFLPRKTGDSANVLREGDHIGAARSLVISNHLHARNEKFRI